MLAAVARGQHRLKDPFPWVLDDPFAMLLVGPGWAQLVALAEALFPENLQREVRAWAAVRSRYAEDRLTQGAFTQYVMLGAGLDSLAWRRPDLLGAVTMFEVDHPASQAWKRERVDALGLPVNDRHLFVPIDFEVESLGAGLDAAGFDWAQPTLFSWLGVMLYLTTEAVETTLRTSTACPSGSEVVFTYRADESVLDDAGREFAQIFEPLAAQSGEPAQPGRSGKEIEGLVTGCGLRVEELPNRATIVSRYFEQRSDALVPSSFEGLAVAAVP